MGLILKNPLAGETVVRGFSKPGEGFFFLMKTMGGGLTPTSLVFLVRHRVDRAVAA
jgi:hypothetical protein